MGEDVLGALVPATVEARPDFMAAPALRRWVWLDLARPVTLVPIAAIAVVFGILPIGRVPSLDQFLHLLLAGGMMVVANFCSNLLNQFDPEDLYHPDKQDRPVAAGVVDPGHVLTVAMMGWGAGLALSVVFLPTTFVLVLLAVMCFAWLYSAPPHLKRYWPLSMAMIAVPRGGLGILAMWSIYGSVWDVHLWQILVVTVGLTFLGNSAKDIDDAAADAAVGTSTVATLWGDDVCRDVAALGFIWPVLMVALLGLYATNPYLWVTVLFAAVGIYGSRKWSGGKLWRAWYGVYAAIAVLFLLPLVAPV